jgi:hypothetical protein
MYYFNFTITEFSTSQVACEGTLIRTLQTGLTAAGFTCSTVLHENNDAQFRALKNGTIYHIGGQFDRKTSPCKAVIAVKHSRSLVDKLLIRNRLAPQNYIEKTLRDMIKAIPDVSDLQESQCFGEIGADNGTFVEIRQ